MPLYEYRCNHCGEFEAWRTIAERDNAPPCPHCQGDAQRIFAAPMVNLNSGSLSRLSANPEPRLVKREREPKQPCYQPSRCDRPWMVGHGSQ